MSSGTTTIVVCNHFNKVITMNTLRKLKLSHRFVLLIGLFVLGFLIYGFWSIKTLNELKVNGPLYQRIVNAKDLAADAMPPPVFILESYLVALQLTRVQSDADQSKLIARFKTLKNDYDTRHDFWSKAGLDAQLNDALIKQVHAPVVDFYTVAFNEFIPAIEKKDQALAGAALHRMSDAYEKHRQEIDRVIESITKINTADEAFAKKEIHSATLVLATLFVVSLGVAIVAAVFINRSIIGPMQEALAIARTVASGDLSSRIDADFPDETGQLLKALKDMNQGLVDIVVQVRTGSDLIATASVEIATGNMDLSARTEQQAGSLEETASAMEELTSTVKQNADNASEANQLARSASEVAIEGGKWCRKWSKRWAQLMNRPRRLSTSSASLMASLSRPISWR